MSRKKSGQVSTTAKFAAKEFEYLVRPHLELLYRLAYRWTKRTDLAEDLLQELLVKLYPRLGELRQLDKPRSWMAKVLYRIYVDNYRRELRSPILLNKPGNTGDMYELAASTEPGPESAYEQNRIQAQLLQEFDQLTETHQVMLSLRDIEGYSLQEIAGILGQPLGTVKSQLHRARTALRERLIKGPEKGNLLPTTNVSRGRKRL
ncbi:MAG: sigma-70 family RNA polymerase sigma factor [Gammaproteobacteria bacterium]|nr:MAG: sigma-70 family RNA polymerase sigma factor [Gammaproteobacteria bacterium]